MAEIEFKRRGTPLWLVLLVLLLVGGAAYFFLARRPDVTPAVAPTADPAIAGVDTTVPKVETVAPPTAATGPTVEFARFVDAGGFPASGAQAQRTFLTDATRRMADVLQERAPTAGVQMVLLRAVADTIAMPDTKADRIPDLTQLAMFAFAHALTAAKVDDGRLATAAGTVQLAVPLSEQSRQVNDYFKTARDLLTKGANAPAATPGALPAPPAPRS